MTETYWENVKNNLTAISFMSIALTVILAITRQGIGEQALQRGLNTENTAKKYEEHRELIRSCTEKQVYMPYFLQMYNERNTKLRKREFLVNNNFTSEKNLFMQKDVRAKILIHRYNKIHTNITPASIKWATTEIVYDKAGKIVPLSVYKHKQLISGIITSLLAMVATAFLTRGLFFEAADVPLWQKFVKLLTYIVTIVLGSLMSVVKNYEKGAFSVPNELDEINEIWREFIAWDVPEDIINFVERESMPVELQEVNEKEAKANDEKRENVIECRRDIQKKSEESEVVQLSIADCILGSSGTCGNILCTDNK